MPSHHAEGETHDPEASHTPDLMPRERGMLGLPESRHRAGVRAALRDGDGDCHLSRAGGGVVRGKGTLTLANGKQYHFKVSGLDVVAVGFKQATGVGHVYHLQKVKDFEGTYVAATASGTVGGGMGATALRNEKGVVINLTGVGQGVDFRLAVSGMTVKLTK